jgi:hypothetical protein
MSEESDNLDPNTDRLDRATSARLSKLRTMPVETAGLRRAVEAAVPPPVTPLRAVWLRPMRAVAASLVVIGALAAVILFWSAQPVLASPQQLAALHDHNISGSSHATPVTSLDAARGVLSRQWPGAPGLPMVEQGQVTSCCVHHLGRKKVACVCLHVDGTPVSLVVGDADDLDAPGSTTVTKNGVTYQVHSSGGVNMLMAEHAGRWVCIMGRLPAERLAALAGDLRF